MVEIFTNMDNVKILTILINLKSKISLFINSENSTIPKQ